ncbi:EpsG family protein [Prochlorococcus marinus]|uniref:EpsG family protein n=1 Tax=Prochlorococcus marinus TaxID=1219 RepID=UPI0022B5E45B|nr:EpsG family protein [Prochlorococcus marinus]
MWLYYLLIIIFFWFGWEGSKSPSKSRKLFTVGIIFLTFFVGFRHEVGCDYLAYEFQYGNIESTVGESGPWINKFYWALVITLNNLNLPYESLNVITSIVFFSGFWKLARRFNNPAAILAFSFPFLIFALPMSATRQALAMGVAFFGINELLERRFLFSFLWFLTASQFHSSGMIFIGFIPLLFWKDTKKAWLFASPFLIAFALFIFSSSAYELAIYRYGAEGLGEDSKGAIYRTLVLFLFGGYFQLSLKNLWKMKLPKSFPLINLSTYCMIAIFLMSYIIPTIADRLGYYLFIFLSIIASQVPSLLKNNSENIYFLMQALITIVFVVWSIFSWQVQFCYSPYNTWLFG